MGPVFPNVSPATEVRGFFLNLVQGAAGKWSYNALRGNGAWTFSANNVSR